MINSNFDMIPDELLTNEIAEEVTKKYEELLDYALEILIGKNGMEELINISKNCGRDKSRCLEFLKQLGITFKNIGDNIFGLSNLHILYNDSPIAFIEFKCAENEIKPTLYIGDKNER